MRWRGTGSESTSGGHDDGDTVEDVGRMQLNHSIALDETISFVQDDASPRTASFNDDELFQNASVSAAWAHALEAGLGSLGARHGASRLS